MSTIDKLKASHLNARKTKTRLGFYTNLVSELNAIAKNRGDAPTEQDALAVIKSNIKKLVDSNQNLKNKIAKGEITGNTPEINTYFEENEIRIKLLEELKPPLTAQLSEEGLRSILSDSCRECKKGDFMKYLKTNYAGQYDGALASKVFDAFINE